MKKKFSQGMSFLLTAAIAVSFIGCSSSQSTSSAASSEAAASSAASAESSSAAENSSEAASTPKYTSVVALDAVTPANTSGNFENTWWGKILAEDIGVAINVLPAGNSGTDKLQTLMASGALPDIVVWNDLTQLPTAIKGNMLVNLDEHTDALPNAVKNAAESMKYNRDERSNGTGKCYTIGNLVGPAEIADHPNWGPYMRWDLYKKLGYPEINSFDDYLKVIADMVKLYPTTASGEKVYGIELFKDWDSAVMSNAIELASVNGKVSLGYTEIDTTTNEVTDELAENSKYIECLKFFYKANQMGLVDPDSLTQTFETARDKNSTGRSVWGWWRWYYNGYLVTDNTENATNPSEYLPVPFKGEKCNIDCDNSIGSTWLISIGSATKNLDAALRYVDYMYSVEGLTKLQNGVEGEEWQKNSEGKNEFTTEGWSYVNDSTKELPGGGKLADGCDLVNWYGLSEAFVDPSTGEGNGWPFWSSTVKYQSENATPMKKDWIAKMGSKNYISYLNDNNMANVYPLASSMVESMPTDISATVGRIGSIVASDSWKMIYAKDDAEYKQYYDDMVTKAKGLGIASVQEWAKKAWQTALTKAANYK